MREMAKFCMKMKFFPKDAAVFLLVTLLSACAGFLNGIIGVGGGMLFMLIPGLVRHDCDAKEIFAFAMACVIPISAVSLLFYRGVGAVDSVPMLLSILAPSILGGAAGAMLCDKIKSKWLNIAFAVLTIYSGASMIFRR